MSKPVICAASLALLGAIMAASAAAQTAPTIAPPPPCGPSVGGLSFICNVVAPEDLKVIPGTKWMIASGMVEGQGLKLVDTVAKTSVRWDTGAQHKAMQDRAAYPTCAAPIEAGRYNSHGLSLRQTGQGQYKLYVVAHGGRESIEIYDVDARAAAPTLTWRGCLMAPEGGHRFNSVTSFADGEVLATIPTLPGRSTADSAAGRNTGAVFQWKPGQPAFRMLPGTELPGPNGIDASKDGKEFFVIAFGARQVVAFDRSDNPKIQRRSPTLHFLPDNIAWDGDRLIGAGSFYDDPACGGRRRVVNGATYLAACNRGYVAAQFDPVTLDYTVLSYGESNPAFGGVAAAVVTGDEIWLSSFRADRLAWRKLPKP